MKTKSLLLKLGKRIQSFWKTRKIISPEAQKAGLAAIFVEAAQIKNENNPLSKRKKTAPNFFTVSFPIRAMIVQLR